MSKIKTTAHQRESFVLARIISAAISSANAVYCTDGEEKDSLIDEEPDFIEETAGLILDEVSIGMVESLEAFLDKAKKIHRNNTFPGSFD